MSLDAGAKSWSGAVLQKRPLTVRDVRLVTGLILFVYVLVHFLNHALGNVSLDAMEAGLDWAAGFWRSVLGGGVLYGALAAHAALGVWAIYDRPRFQWSLPQILQLGLGLAIPILLVDHVVQTRLAYSLHGTTRSYGQLLYTFWVASPHLGVQQAVALGTSWIHGCLGLYFWLRLKPGFVRWAPVLLCAAVLVPVLALLGYAQAGRAVVALAMDENWLLEYAPPAADSPVAAARAAALTFSRNLILAGFLAAVALAVLARIGRRVIERRRGLVRLTYPDGKVVRAPRGMSVLEASRMARIPHASVCGGRGRCSTCRVQLFGVEVARIPAAGSAERAVLDRIGAGPDVRLACQLRPTGDLTVAPLVNAEPGRARDRRLPLAFGEERFVVAMFVDMRGSTRLAERHLPFDTVFQINRFLDLVATAVRRSGGSPNQFLGDGMLALFGLEADPATAARQSLIATAAIGAEIAALNEGASGDSHAAVRFGIGVHAGTAILGEIGERGRGHSVFTAIGDPVNVAARLQSMTKQLEVEAMVSDTVYEVAAVPASVPRREVIVEGRDKVISARPLSRATDAFGPAR